MENGHSTEGAVGRCLTLDGNRSLIIGDKHLVLDDASGKRLIPLYNILWAEVVGSQLLIDYAAQPSKTSIKHEKWTYEIPATDNRPDRPEPEAFAAALLSRAYVDAQPRKRAYVLINPNAGPGGALRKWDREVKPLFEVARMHMDVVTLTKGGEAVELAEKVDIDKYDTIMACSGDGTPHEIFNGLARRPDANRALSKIAVSHIPCGSGNAMSCNLYGSHRPVFAALAIIKGVVTPLDLVSITQGDRRLISFLSQSLGIIAESDLGTENLRWMGSRRFDFGVIIRVFRKRCYPCDLAVKVEVDQKDGVRAHYKRHASEASLHQKAHAESRHESEGEGLPPLKYGTIQDDLPEGWELVPYDKIGNFYCGNMAYMAPDLNFFSAAVAADGCMDLVTMNGDLSPITATKTLMSVESGKFFDSPHVSYKKISAYRIIPRNQEDGYISIDGERIPFGPFQAEVHRGLGRVISKRGAFEALGPSNWDSVTVAERLHA
ncbi:Sphingoid long chain base kinase 5 [Tolypocladium ophioglossoides CBS 100239]|uniref:Sphingoid long chain base kinase 5 n=1 Tax=Tolypocladium ophioglossoides (strain CBS 100239) TaxID=1163406 RepID=A0A0L0N173_TOLOC|nr:Sphingoid long chain base kinase 5 [Tolypocladium ophioglossoides CBS 100239]